MGGFSNFAISFSIISILTGAVTLYSHGLVMGGPAEMALGWPLVSAFTLTVALSMAELASSMPTSGAMYHWACRLGGKGWGWFDCVVQHHRDSSPRWRASTMVAPSLRDAVSSACRRPRATC